MAVPDHLLRSIVYIYPSPQAAADDRPFGGTAFLVSVQGVERDEWGNHDLPQSLYVVTAAHVVVGKGPHVLRINKADGGTYPEPVEEDQWRWCEDDQGKPKNDLAVLPIDWSLDTWYYRPVWMASTFREGSSLNPKLGDEVVMIGRFKDYGGKARNIPVARFGNIAMVPEEEMNLRRGQVVRPYLMEMRSRGGHSGSPVYTFEDDFKGRPPRDQHDLRSLPELARPREPRLLGIEHGQYSGYLEVVKKQDDKYEPTSLRVEDGSAMCIVIPVWCLADLLMDERLVEMRKDKKHAPTERDERITPRAPDEAVPEEEVAEEQRPLTREAFEGTLRKVTRRVNEPPEDPTRR